MGILTDEKLRSLSQFFLKDASSVKEVETYHQTRALRSLRKNAQNSSDSSFDKNLEITEKHANGRHFTR